MPGKADSDTGSTTKDNKGRIVIIVLLIAIVVLLIAVIGLVMGSRNGDGSLTEETAGREVRDTSDARLVLDQSDAESMMDQMREEVAEGMFECNMSMTWTFENGKSESKDAYVANSVNNTYPIYFDVYLDSGELVYSSPVLPVGTELTDIKLDVPLDEGDYQATVQYTLIRDEESQEQISQAGFVITMNILK